MDAWEVFEVPYAFVALYENESNPLNPVAGVYLTCPVVWLIVPSARGSAL